ncbi:unnamed protein product [Caenorhabditis angaria]|uniref:SET domain-containing protein n=1 Tax=Caenorhabditis angaria TaxID=860376 RepID=A0A9P1N0G3_9PELO|nr:unnamed protein product [Caenorhabditis angaria]
MNIQIPGICDPEAAIEKKKEEIKYKMVVELEKGHLKIIQGNQKIDPNCYTEIQEIPQSQYELLGKKIADDDFCQDTDIHCDRCNSFYRSFCLKHPLFKIHDKQPQENDACKPYAERTIPHLFVIGESTIPTAGLGVFARAFIPVGMVFGPYKGVRCSKKSEFFHDGYAWEVDGKDGTFYIDGSHPEKSNWLRYINSPRHVNEQNLLAFQVSGRVYYRVIKPIAGAEELLVWYGQEYGEEYSKEFQAQPLTTTPSSKTRISRAKNPFIW